VATDVRSEPYGCPSLEGPSVTLLMPNVCRSARPTPRIVKIRIS
jgi:hypothetical protein